MKLKKYNSVLRASLLSVSCVFGLMSCDGGSSGSASEQSEITIPSAPNDANEEVVGEAFDASGADVSLEGVYQTEVFNGINDERTSRNLSALTLNSDLSALAEEHNQNLISRAIANGNIQIDHEGAQARADSVFANGGVAYGENIAGIRGFGESVVAETFVEGWVNSPGHFENLTGVFTTTGVAVTVDDRDGTIYATQIFSR